MTANGSRTRSTKRPISRLPTPIPASPAAATARVEEICVPLSSAKKRPHPVASRSAAAPAGKVMRSAPSAPAPVAGVGAVSAGVAAASGAAGARRISRLFALRITRPIATAAAPSSQLAAASPSSGIREKPASSAPPAAPSAPSP